MFNPYRSGTTKQPGIGLILVLFYSMLLCECLHAQDQACYLIVS